MELKAINTKNSVFINNFWCMTEPRTSSLIKEYEIADFRLTRLFYCFCCLIKMLFKLQQANWLDSQECKLISNSKFRNGKNVRLGGRQFSKIKGQFALITFR